MRVSRVEMVGTGCDLKQHAIYIFIFIFHNRPAYDLDFALFVRQIEWAPRKVRKSVSFFDFAFCSFSCALMLASDCD